MGGGLPKSQNFCKFEKQCLFGSKTVFFGQEVYYLTELNLQICDYAQKQRICRENCKHALDKNFHGHFCSQRKDAKFCHPESDHSIILTLYLVFSQFFGEPIACDAGEVSKDFKVNAERHLSLSRSIVINAIQSTAAS